MKKTPKQKYTKRHPHICSSLVSIKMPYQKIFWIPNPFRVFILNWTEFKQDRERELKSDWGHKHLHPSCQGWDTYRESGKKGWCESSPSLYSLKAAFITNPEKKGAIHCGSVSLHACVSMWVYCTQTHHYVWPSARSHTGSLAYTRPSWLMRVRYYLFHYEWCCSSDPVHPGISLLFL